MKKRYIVLLIALILWLGYETFRAAQRLIYATQPTLNTEDSK